MKRLPWVAGIVLACCAACLAQDAAVAPARPLPVNPPAQQDATGNTPLQQQKNAGSAQKDTSATTGDQITKPAGEKGSTLIGCLAGPDKQGKYVLRSMQHRDGVEVLGPEDLKNDAGNKVKLTGKWEAPEVKAPQAADKNTAGMRRFQATDVEVMAKDCKPPAETTPVSKNKRQKGTTYNAPSDGSSK